MKRLVERLAMINETLELDGAVLTGEELERKTGQIKRLESADIAVLDELEAEIELMADNKNRDLLLKELLSRGEGFFKNIPIGVHSGMVTENHSGVAVVVRVFRGGIPSILWGFEPDDQEIYKDLIVHGLIPNSLIVENIISCNEETERYLVEDENMDGALFKRVVNIAKKLREIYGAKQVTRKFSEKVPRGNLQYLRGIRQAQSIARRRLMKFPVTEKVNSFLKIYPIGTIMSEITEMANKYISAIKDFQNKIKTSSYKEKKEVEKAYVEETMEFVNDFTEYIEKNKLIEEDDEKRELERTKFELLGFMRLYKS